VSSLLVFFEKIAQNERDHGYPSPSDDSWGACRAMAREAIKGVRAWQGK
jgi:hypothetical protein